MLFGCLPEGIWIDRSKSWNSRRQWWWSRKWELDQKNMQMIGSYLLGCGVWFYPNGSHWSQGLFSKKKKNYAAFRTNGPSSGESPWCLAFHFGFPRTNNVKTSSWTAGEGDLRPKSLLSGPAFPDIHAVWSDARQNHQHPPGDGGEILNWSRLEDPS